MEIYLPIAEQSMNVFILLGLGGAAGLLSGMFGVGGGFLATPLLIFVGIPPAVAVASQANQVVSNSISSLQVHWRRGNVDLRMGLVLLLGGMIGKFRPTLTVCHRHRHVRSGHVTEHYGRTLLHLDH